MCRQLVRLEVELVAIERPDGLLVERLLDAGLRILPLHPNQVAASRDRFRVSGGKSDRFDAFVLCELARTDHHRFRVLEPDCDQTKALRALTRAREDLVGTRTALSNQLRAELDRFWPGPLGLFTNLSSRISLAFLDRYPSPADARGLGEARLQAFLVREHYTGSQKPAELWPSCAAPPTDPAVGWSSAPPVPNDGDARFPRRPRCLLSTGSARPHSSPLTGALQRKRSPRPPRPA